MERLSKRVRQDRILKRLGNDVAVRISELARAFGVTTETIRRDLDEMSARGALARTYGGAAARSLSQEPGIGIRSREQVAERRQIARAAAGLVKTGDVLMIDSGSTVLHFAEALVAANLEIKVITNSLPVARMLGQSEAIAVMLCPGDFRATEDAVFGPETLSHLDHYHADLTILGAGGLTVQEVTDADPAAVWVKRKMLARAGRRVLLVDHAKFGLTHFASVCAIGAWTDIVTDAATDGETLRQLREQGLAVHIAGAEPGDAA